MERGAIEIDSLSGGLNLEHTIESGQSYLWRRSDGNMFDGDSGDAWYETVADGLWIRARQRDHLLEWESNGDPVPTLTDLLRLHDELETIYASFPEDPLIKRAVELYPGMRLVNDPVFPCLISFICSSQMRVERIHQMQMAIAEAFGNEYIINNTPIYAFPEPEQLAEATETELRALGLGYRAPYVRDTANMVAEGIDPGDAQELQYEEARTYLTQFVGVGEKVADCVLLFALNFLEAVPLDTWIRQTIEAWYTDCNKGSYAATSSAIREAFGGTYAGYAQTYVFHAARLGEPLVPE